MSVSRSSDEGIVSDLFAFNDYETQRLYVNFTANTDGQNNDAGTITYNFDVMKGQLERNQVAELVATIPGKAYLHADGAPDAAGAYVQWPFSFWTSPGIRGPGDTSDVEPDTVGLVDGTWSDSTGHSLEYFTLYEGSMTLMPPYESTATSEYHGGSVSQNGMAGGQMVPWRRWFGRGPVAHHDDWIRFGGTLDYADLQDVKIQSEVSMICVWDVFEQDTAEYKDIR